MPCRKRIEDRLVQHPLDDTGTPNAPRSGEKANIIAFQPLGLLILEGVALPARRENAARFRIPAGSRQTCLREVNHGSPVLQLRATVLFLERARIRGAFHHILSLSDNAEPAPRQNSKVSHTGGYQEDTLEQTCCQE
jgi:hypothetical protein